jgi:hypothetical protein
MMQLYFEREEHTMSKVWFITGEGQDIPVLAEAK